MRVTKLEKAQQIVAALYNLPELPTSGINYDRAVTLARKSVEVIDPQWRLANKLLLDRQKVAA